MKTERDFENWKRTELVTISDPDINEVTVAEEHYDFMPMMTPFQVKS